MSDDDLKLDLSSAQRAAFDAEQRYDDHFGRRPPLVATGLDRLPPEDYVDALERAIKADTEITHENVHEFTDQIDLRGIPDDALL